MCGITGYLEAPEARPDCALDAAVAALHHRGPDDQGTWRDGPAGLGFARLSILDLSPAGHQPMSSACGRFVIAFNGEIYNFRELRVPLEQAGLRFSGHSDTEVLLATLIRHGFEAGLARLRGMFAIALYDRQEQALHLARDRLGVKPLVYAQDAQGFYFASEIAAVLALRPALPRTPDFAALDHYLTFQYIPAPMSGFAAIRKLPPAHAMTVRAGRVQRLWRYWRIDPAHRSPLSFDEACEALREKVMEATRLRLVSDVPLGAFLSGGVDSSITVAAMARLNARPLKTYAIGFDDEKFNELPYARQVAAHVGAEHHEEMVHAEAVRVLPDMIRHLGEPLADNSIIPTYYVSRFARSGVTVALTGDGGDEVFAGYRRYYQMRRMDWLASRGLTGAWTLLRRAAIGLENLSHPGRAARTFPASRADEALGLPPLQAWRHLLAFIPETEKSALYTPAFRGRMGAPATLDYLARQHALSDGMEPLNRWLHLDMTTFMPEDILFKVDSASMAVSLECRSPFLDHELIELAFSLPAHYKLSTGGRHKHILKEAFGDWLPPGFFNRPKQGFSAPLSRWLREDLAEPLQDLLLGNRLLAPWFEQAAIERYVREHLSGARSHSTRLWPLFVLALWLEAFAVSA
jgi:asparagine synthase (glutamine-hydrolysing)